MAVNEYFDDFFLQSDNRARDT